jgi:hypothetical protein
MALESTKIIKRIIKIRNTSTSFVDALNNNKNEKAVY